MYTDLAVVVLAGLLGPLLASGRRLRVPVLVTNLTGGILLGRTALHLIDPASQPFPVFASLGFAMLMLESGTEIDLASKLLRDSAVRAGLAFLVALLAPRLARPPRAALRPRHRPGAVRRAAPPRPRTHGAGNRLLRPDLLRPSGGQSRFEGVGALPVRHRPGRWDGAGRHGRPPGGRVRGGQRGAASCWPPGLSAAGSPRRRRRARAGHGGAQPAGRDRARRGWIAHLDPGDDRRPAARPRRHQRAGAANVVRSGHARQGRERDLEERTRRP